MEVAVSGIECKWITTEQGPAPGEAQYTIQDTSNLEWNGSPWTQLKVAAPDILNK